MEVILDMIHRITSKGQTSIDKSKSEQESAITNHMKDHACE